MENIQAFWDIHLYCECPFCKDYVDLLEFVDFWDGVKFNLGEHDTDRTKGVDVTCPNCEEEFTVDLTY